MSKRMAEWGRRERARLVRVFGERCNACGSTRDLEFDCIKPMGHRHHTLNQASRICFYRKQMRGGNLQLLCHECNERKGGKSMRWLLETLIKEGKISSHTSIIKRGEHCEQLRPPLIPAGIHGLVNV